MPTEEEKYYFPWRKHDMNERLEGHLFEVSCPTCGHFQKIEMTPDNGQRSEFSREEIVQKFAETHEEVRLGMNKSPCTATFDSFKVENLNEKKKEK